MWSGSPLTGLQRMFWQSLKEDLKALAAAGLEMVYIGAESGDDRVLEHIHKDVTAAQIAAAGQKLKRCGIKTSVTLISGLGGRKGIRERAIKSAELINQMNPEYASFLTLRLYEGTQMNEEVKRGRWSLSPRTRSWRKWSCF